SIALVFRAGRDGETRPATGPRAESAAGDGSIVAALRPLRICGAGGALLRAGRALGRRLALLAVAVALAPWPVVPLLAVAVALASRPVVPLLTVAVALASRPVVPLLTVAV